MRLDHMHPLEQNTDDLLTHIRYVRSEEFEQSGAEVMEVVTWVAELVRDGTEEEIACIRLEVGRESDDQGSMGRAFDEWPVGIRSCGGYRALADIEDYGVQ